MHHAHAYAQLLWAVPARAYGRGSGSPLLNSTRHSVRDISGIGPNRCVRIAACIIVHLVYYNSRSSSCTRFADVLKQLALGLLPPQKDAS